MSHKDGSLIIAIYGAVAGSIGGAWALVQICQSRRRLRIQADITLDLSNIPYKTMLIKVTNLNKRPIQAQGIHFYKSRRDFRKRPRSRAEGFNPATWRKTLQEGDSVVADLKDYKRLCSGCYGYVFVLDSVGKRWPLSRRMLRRLKEAATGPDKLPMPTITEITEEPRKDEAGPGLAAAGPVVR